MKGALLDADFALREMDDNVKDLKLCFIKDSL